VSFGSEFACWCDVPDCANHASYTPYPPKTMFQQAIEAGWRLSRVGKIAVCPTHARLGVTCKSLMHGRGRVQLQLLKDPR